MRALVAVLGVLGCARAAPSTQAPGNPPLRKALLERLTADQAVRDTLVERMQAGQLDSVTVAHQQRVDSSNTAWLKGVVARSGWPSRRQVGADGAEAAFLIVQHADQDTSFQARMLPLLEQAATASDLPWQQVALLSDRLAVHRGQPQRYGTQASLVDGKVHFAPIADSEHVDERRANIGLPPLAVYARVLDSVYLGHTSTP